MPWLDDPKAVVSPGWYALTLPHTYLYWLALPTLNVVKEHPALVCDRPHVLLEYDVKLSPAGQLWLVFVMLIKVMRLHPTVPQVVKFWVCCWVSFLFELCVLVLFLSASCSWLMVELAIWRMSYLALSLSSISEHIPPPSLCSTLISVRFNWPLIMAANPKDRHDSKSKLYIILWKLAFSSKVVWLESLHIYWLSNTVATIHLFGYCSSCIRWDCMLTFVQNY